MNLDSYNVAELNHNEVVEVEGGLLPVLPWAAWGIITAVSLHMMTFAEDIGNGLRDGWNANR